MADAALEKRAGSESLDDKATDWSASEPMPELASDSDLSRYSSVQETDFGSGRYFSRDVLPRLPPGSPSGSSHQVSALDLPSDSYYQDLSPPSPAASYHEGSHIHNWLYFVRRPRPYLPGYDDGHSASSHDSAPVLPSGSVSHSGSVGSMPDLQPDSGTPQSHDDLPPQADLQPESGTPQSHDNLPPKADKFFNDALKHKIKVYAGLGTIVGFSVGFGYGLQKLINGTDPHAYVSALFPPTFNQVTNI